MRDRERILWMDALVGVLGTLVFIIVVTTLMPGPNAHEAPVIVTWITLIGLPVYGLILSWRLAYLSGRKRR
jgi:hypothetical protein